MNGRAPTSSNQLGDDDSIEGRVSAFSYTTIFCSLLISQFLFSVSEFNSCYPSMSI